jgi:hypothetical protein
MLSSGRLTPRRQYVLFFALVVGVAVAGYLVGHPRGRSAGVLDAVPRGAWLVVTVDVAAVRSSPIAQPLLSAGVGTSLPGLGSLSEACGFDPLSRMKELLVTSPENGEHGDFGLAFTGDFTRDELARCAEKAIRARGGSPATSTHGAFTTVEDTADAKHGRVAYREGGPYLVGRGAWLDAMIDAVEARREGPGPEHTALRASLAPKAGSAQAIVLTALLPTALREKLKGELGAELGSEADKAYVSVLAVSQAGLALGTGGAGSTTELVAELRCETPAACNEVKALVGRKRLAFSRELGVRLLGLGPLLDSLKVDSTGPSLSASAQAPTDDLARAVQRALDFKGIGPGQAHASPGRQPAPAPATPTPSAP